MRRDWDGGKREEGERERTQGRKTKKNIEMVEKE